MYAMFAFFRDLGTFQRMRRVRTMTDKIIGGLKLTEKKIK